MRLSTSAVTASVGMSPPAPEVRTDIVVGGYAREHTYDRSAYWYQASFRAEQETARAAGVGLMTRSGRGMQRYRSPLTSATSC
ncbi:hypothetical protein C5C16_12055 [Rathayibacter rathayi]|uniref:Uncharacterized protein n=1 Tax=Rathayibacter rathayi TaxID=33887 RepID=A0ABX5AEI9_RATRA|nr:hypothetical protein C5C16_12055 [Rathayibacter rathayi]PPG75150.1 hypothetical protein C5C15_13440 [Rathayibacter rathayi]PPH79084.1 hypothetical protein C5C40_03865 [Rathayibacter rathayi]PPI68071.1 hypothetical protein C5D98_11740 [Rathayibacter rathayi]